MLSVGLPDNLSAACKRKLAPCFMKIVERDSPDPVRPMSPEPAEQDGLTPATVAEMAAAKGLQFEWTPYPNGGQGGWFVYDKLRLDNPGLIAPMFGRSLSVVVEIVEAYDPENVGLTFYKGVV